MEVNGTTDTTQTELEEVLGRATPRQIRAALESLGLTRRGGPALFETYAHGDDWPACTEDALTQAAKLYGPDAPLRIEWAGTMRPAGPRQNGAYEVCIRVRCTELPDGWDVP